MRIISMKVKNYRVLHDVKIDFSSSYCTISGKNNAGKSCVIRLLTLLFERRIPYSWSQEEDFIDYKEDYTQWASPGGKIEINYTLQLTQDEDPALISFLEKIAEIKISGEKAIVVVSYSLSENSMKHVAIEIDGKAADEKAVKEIDKRIKDSNLLFLYNSTFNSEDIYYIRHSHRFFYDMIMSEAEKKEVDEAAKQVLTQFKRVAKDHKQGLNSIIGKLSERYDVELSLPESSSYSRMPLSINLKDKLVEVPLDCWGSGTQNRTRIMMAILQANKIKTTESAVEKITPFVVVEEPECFLHPSAQAEFGRILRSLSVEFGIQIIVTTHSPYMLNQDDSEANILLVRECVRSQIKAACVADTSGSSWMAPFAEQLGISPSEFEMWRPILTLGKSHVLLVEGKLDKECFEFIRDNKIGSCQLSGDVEIVNYDGWVALKNTVLLQFMLRKFDKFFITYDLDSEQEVKRCMDNLGLKKNIDYSPVGVGSPGKDRLEGLFPESIFSAVFARETDDVLRLGSQSKDIKKSASNSLKRKMLDEFKLRTDYSEDEMIHFSKLFKIINKKFTDVGSRRGGK